MADILLSSLHTPSLPHIHRLQPSDSNAPNSLNRQGSDLFRALSSPDLNIARQSLIIEEVAAMFTIGDYEVTKVLCSAASVGTALRRLCVRGLRPPQTEDCGSQATQEGRQPSVERMRDSVRCTVQSARGQILDFYNSKLQQRHVQNIANTGTITRRV